MINDCELCWNTPCTCGWEYRNYSIQELVKMQIMFTKLIEYKVNNSERVLGSRDDSGIKFQKAIGIIE